MKEEIKEILDRLDAEEFELPVYSSPITWAEMFKIRDYITNLQQENEHLRTQVNTYENPDDYTLFYMWSDAKDKMKQLQEEKEDYKSRCEKAKEYINHEIFKRTILVGVGTKKYTRSILDNVLKILKGSDEEWQKRIKR